MFFNNIDFNIDKKMKCLNEINDNNEKTYSRFGY